jgi:hypothetical protein
MAQLSDFGDDATDSTETTIDLQPDTVRRTVDDLVRETVGGTHDDELLNFDAFCGVRAEAADAVRAVVEQEVDA